MGKIKIYISASLSNSKLNKRIADILETRKINVLLPQEFDELEDVKNVHHHEYPTAIFRKCVDAMESSDIGLIIFDAYGRDSSWEAGWYFAEKKPLVGFVSESLYFTRDWMIKGGLESFITDNRIIYEHVKNDPILSKKKIYYIKNLNEMPEVIYKI